MLMSCFWKLSDGNLNLSTMSLLTPSKSTWTYSAHTMQTTPVVMHPSPSRPFPMSMAYHTVNASNSHIMMKIALKNEITKKVSNSGLLNIYEVYRRNKYVSHHDIFHFLDKLSQIQVFCKICYINMRIVKLWEIMMKWYVLFSVLKG